MIFKTKRSFERYSLFLSLLSGDDFNSNFANGKSGSESEFGL